MAMIGSGLAPAVAYLWVMPSLQLSAVGSMFMPYPIIMGIIIAITLVTNIVRSLRYCRTKKGQLKSFGIRYGISKGIIISIIAALGYTLFNFIPILKAPLTVLRALPFDSAVALTAAIDGIVVAVGYLFGYMILYPFYGSC